MILPPNTLRIFTWQIILYYKYLSLFLHPDLDDLLYTRAELSDALWSSGSSGVKCFSHRERRCEIDFNHWKNNFNIYNLLPAINIMSYHIISYLPQYSLYLCNYNYTQINACNQEILSSNGIAKGGKAGVMSLPLIKPFCY